MQTLKIKGTCFFLIQPNVEGGGFQHFYLDTGARLQFAKAADQGPAAGRDVGDFGDGLHPLRTGDAHLQKRLFVTTNSALSAQSHGSSMLAMHMRVPRVSTGHS